MSGRIGLKAQRLLAKRLHPALAFLASAGGISAQKGKLQMGCPQQCGVLPRTIIRSKAFSQRFSLLVLKRVRPVSDSIYYSSFRRIGRPSSEKYRGASSQEFLPRDRAAHSRHRSRQRRINGSCELCTVPNRNRAELSPGCYVFYQAIAG